MSTTHMGASPQQEGAVTLYNTITRHNKQEQDLKMLVEALRSIYDSTASSTSSISGLTTTLSTKLKNWYLNERMKHSYGRLEPIEADMLSSLWQREVTKRQALPVWNTNTRFARTIENFSRDPYYGFKQFVEIMARSIVEEKIKATGMYTQVRVLLASDHDDMDAGVDLIAECTDKKGAKHIFGIDIAVAYSQAYLHDKSKNENCYPEEYFGRHKTVDPRLLPRIVMNILPESMSGVIEGFIDDMKNGTRVDSKKIADRYNLGSSGADVQYGVQQGVQYIITH